MWAIIGGSGFESFKEFSLIEDVKIETPYGEHSSSLKKVMWNDTQIVFISRHGANHELLPSEINYRANIYALKKLGVKGILSFSAVGSLKEELAPEDMVFINQYMDFTKHRATSFCGQGSVGHYPFAHPVSVELSREVESLLKNTNFKKHYNKTYVCIEGPRFSSVAESKMFIKWGADIIGMTNMPECYLALEAGLLYLPFCFVTDYDCWKEDEDHVTIEIVKTRMKKNLESAKEILNKVVTEPLYEKHKVLNINDCIFSGKKIDWLN